MKQDGKYRFSLQFSGNTEKKQKVGELLEGMGNKKSALIVEVLANYLENHPELVKENNDSMLPSQNFEQKFPAMQESIPMGTRIDSSVTEMLDNLNSFV